MTKHNHIDSSPVLERLEHPGRLKDLSLQELEHLAAEIRDRIIDVLSRTGGHLSSNLGIVELTIALHTIFSSPEDRLIFDVGHQSYVHKLLTGRNQALPSLRQTGGLSGFTSPQESPHDHLYSGHAGNTLSFALGMAISRSDQDRSYIVPILGDASLTCGLTLEAFNHIPHSLHNFLIVLNDNAMSISKNVGRLPSLLAHDPSSFFHQLGLDYLGPVDGNCLEQLLQHLQTVKQQRCSDRPTLIHIKTVKGLGMREATDHPTPYHGAKPFDKQTGRFLVSKPPLQTFPQYFGRHLLRLAQKYPQLIAVTPAMPLGSCLSAFQEQFPERCIDVGIAEGHAVTLSCGIALDRSNKVVTVIYSTFLQRAFDNIYHDLCVQKIPLLLAIDRAGLATGDGVTAQGLYDLPFLNSMPGLIIAQPRDGMQLERLMSAAMTWNCPTAIRYPNLPTAKQETTTDRPPVLVGKGELLVEGEEVVILPLGHMYVLAMEVVAMLHNNNIYPALIDPIFMKPLDVELITKLCQPARIIITLEEHTLQGGWGSIVNSLLIQQGLTSGKTIYNFGLPDRLIPHGSYHELLKQAGLTKERITHTIEQALKANRARNP